MNTINSEISASIQATKPRSAWSRGVKLYALELLESLESDYTPAALLNGAENWRAFSYGGSALIYDADIAERLATASELKRKKGGDLPPNAGETWLDCQARALHQAARLVARKSKHQLPRCAELPRCADYAVTFAEEAGCSYSDALAYCNMD